MHQLNDVVVYVESGVEINALVLASAFKADVIAGQSTKDAEPSEHLTLVFVPAVTQGVQNLTALAHGIFLRTVYGVLPLKDGRSAGWKEVGVSPLEIETRHYADGTSATGVAPLPILSPYEQEQYLASANEAAAEESRLAVGETAAQIPQEPAPVPVPVALDANQQVIDTHAEEIADAENNHGQSAVEEHHE